MLSSLIQLRRLALVVASLTLLGYRCKHTQVEKKWPQSD